MSAVAGKNIVNQTFNRVNDGAIKDKQELNNEQVINSLLDSILDLKKALNDRIASLEEVITNIEELTWFDPGKIDDDSKRKVNSVISIARGWSADLRKWCDFANKKLNPKVRPCEIDTLSHLLDDLDEVVNILENACFKYPKDEEFNSITKELSKLL